MIDDFELPERLGELVRSTIRTFDIDVQAVELLVRAQGIQLDVHALLVASDANALRRVHRDIEVWFIDGTDGDNGLVIDGGFEPDFWVESVVFTDGTTGDNGLVTTMPIPWAEEFVVFTEDGFAVAVAIQEAEFVTFADYAIAYVLDFLASEQFRFADLSVAWQGVFSWDETVVLTDSMAVLGGNTVALNESVNISEVMIGGPIVQLADAVRWSEFVTYILDFQIQPETVTVTDALNVSVVAATDARPGAFIPGAALLGSPT